MLETRHQDGFTSGRKHLKHEGQWSSYWRLAAAPHNHAHMTTTWIWTKTPPLPSLINQYWNIEKDFIKRIVFASVFRLTVWLKSFLSLLFPRCFSSIIDLSFPDASRLWAQSQQDYRQTSMRLIIQTAAGRFLPSPSESQFTSGRFRTGFINQDGANRRTDIGYKYPPSEEVKTKQNIFFV